MEQTSSKPKHRGKLYTLSDESQWEDTGTGYASINTVGHERRLVFREEETDEVLHDRPLFQGAYQLQGEGDRQTIIVWEDPDTQKDWALSFQDADGTTEIWEALSAEFTTEEKRVLPWPRLGNLTELCRMLTCVPPSQREVLATECLHAKFLGDLREVFHTAEDLDNDEAKISLWHITKGIFLLSSQKVTERYLRSDVYEDVLGMLEYDAGLPPSRRTAHRQVMKVKVQFKDVVPFEDAETLDRIHLNYRLQYLKDIVLPRILDDAAFVSLTQMINGNVSIILDHLQKSASLLDQLFVLLQKKDLQSLLFMQDACRLATKIPPSERQALYEKMIERKLFALLVAFFGEGRVEGESASLHPQHLAVEVLLFSAQHDPSPLRSFLTSESSTEGRTLLSALIRRMLTEEDQGVQGQIAEMLKAVMDPTPLEQRERDGCLDVFYERGAFDELVEPLRSEAVKAAGQPALFGQQLICELLAFAVLHHGYRARIYVIRHGLAQQAFRLLAAPQRFLQLAPVRLLKAMVATKDEAYHRYLTKNGLFTPVLRCFQQSIQPPAFGGNLLVSATLEMFELIRVENVKHLVDHICRKHEDIIRELAPRFKTFEGLLLRHQQNLEYEAFPPEQHTSGGPISRGCAAGGRGGRVRSPGREEDSDDDYFESLDDDDDDGDGEGSVSAPDAPSVPTPGEGSAAAEPRKAVEAASANGEETAGAVGLKGLLGSYDDEEEEEGGEHRPSHVEGEGVEQASSVGAAGTAAVAGPGEEAFGGASSEATDVEGVGSGNGGVAGGGSMKRSGVAEESGKSQAGVEDVVAEGSDALPTGGCEVAVAEQCPVGQVAVAEEVEEAAPKEGGEKALNHVSKRLKTSEA